MACVLCDSSSVAKYDYVLALLKTASLYSILIFFFLSYVTFSLCVGYCGVLDAFENCSKLLCVYVAFV